MKRKICLLLALVFMLSLSTAAFADGDVLFCRKCGQQIPSDSNFCPYCGTSVVQSDGSTAVTPSAASPKSDAPAQGGAAASGSGADYSNLLNRVRVTKSPTSESVPYGGSCTFIAHAANATSVTWILTTSDGSFSAPAYEAADIISGLYVSGGNTDTLKLSGIPSWMNGCMVQACFTGEGGPVYTEAARIWTYQEQSRSSSSDEGEMLWWWPYRFLADPYANELPWWWWYNQFDGKPNPPDVRHAVTLPDGQSFAPEKPGPGFIYDRQEAVITGHIHTPGASDPDPKFGGSTSGPKAADGSINLPDPSADRMTPGPASDRLTLPDPSVVTSRTHASGGDDADSDRDVSLRAWSNEADPDEKTPDASDGWTPLETTDAPDAS